MRLAMFFSMIVMMGCGFYATGAQAWWLSTPTQGKMVKKEGAASANEEESGKDGKNSDAESGDGEDEEEEEVFDLEEEMDAEQDEDAMGGN